MERIKFAAVVLAVSLLFGCAGRGDEAPAAQVVTVSPSPTVSPTPSPSPSVKTATAKQYASVVNPVINKLGHDWDTYEEHCFPGEEEPLCDIYATTLDMRAQLVVATLTGAMKADAPDYIGAPPAEIVKLVDETMTAAQVLDNTIEDGTGIIDGTVFPAGMDARNYVDRWEPYV